MVLLRVRRRRLLLVALVAAGLAAAFFWLQLPRPGVTRANFERLEEGMTLEEVETILGRPGVGYLMDEDDLVLPDLVSDDPENPANINNLWVGYEILVLVDFDAHIRVCHKRMEDRPRPTSFLKLLRRLLGQ
jgi:hypothetical protein